MSNFLIRLLEVVVALLVITFVGAVLASNYVQGNDQWGEVAVASGILLFFLGGVVGLDI